jgi:oxygen-independent coproporphyrinogen-3 oxidase
MQNSNLSSLISKYDVPAPRYTSYPTVPYWETPPTTNEWLIELKKAAERESTKLSIYLHIPFCESLCTFCGCNSTITKDHNREDGYIKLIHQELESYLKNVPRLNELELLEIHLGGGTPTFLSPANLQKLMAPFSKIFSKNRDTESSIEVDPRRTNTEHLKALFGAGFRRVSMGVQDFNSEVQLLVNRLQPPEITSKLTSDARHIGFTSVNFDLIYGLPKQSLSYMKATVDLTLQMKPDRIALYSYAHVPWIKPAQRLFTEDDLPVGHEKRKLYELAREALTKAGYVEIGMDHFALKTDSLCQALEAGLLHRNFMGYTARRTEILLGLGVSAISETPTCFHQNEKNLPVYERRVGQGEIPTLRGHLLTAEDQLAREQILNLMTKFKTQLDSASISDMTSFLAPLIEDGLVEITSEGEVTLPEAGRPFLRNICMAFDRRLRAKQPQARVFSQSV